MAQLLLPYTTCTPPRTEGATADTEGYSAAIALASSSVSVATAPEPSRTPLLLRLPGSTTIRLLPILWICAWIRAVAPVPTPTMAITAATPITMQSIVRAERVLFTFNARNAIFTLATS